MRLLLNLVYLSLCLLVLAGSLSAQGNLIRNFDFEEIECPDNPINSVSETTTWYATGADVYWMHRSCPVDPVASANIVAIKPNLPPYSGSGYVSLEGILFKNGFYLTEGIGIELTETLKAGHAYYFDMATMHYDLEESIDFPAGGCDPLPERLMEVRFSNERIVQTKKDTMIGISAIVLSGISINAKLKLVDKSPEQPNFRNNRWNAYWNCFIADGTERHLAITGKNGPVGVENKCLTENEAGFVYQGGHAVDAVRLYEIPSAVDSMLSLCSEDLDIDLRDLFSGPYTDKADYHWEDGLTGYSRRISTPGIYSVEMVLPCISVPITLRVEDGLCAAAVFVPNAFSPNRDGINDRLQPFMKTVYEIKNYQFSVFDRWGNLVFRTRQMEEEWDGRIGNRPAPAGVYIWSLEYTLAFGEEKRQLSRGEVLLLR
ncbi:MAG: gliding motility-associated C-terminal domain-containing protein [Saprospiraceae bacterium]